MITSLTVTDIAFELDGTTIITFLASDDIRCGGSVAVRKSVRIEPSEQYRPDIDKLIGRARALVTDALDDWERSQPVPPEQLGTAHPQRPFASEQADRIDEDDDATAERNWDRIEQARQGEQAQVPADQPQPPTDAAGAEAAGR